MTLFLMHAHNRQGVCMQFLPLWAFSDKARYAHLQAQSTDRCLLRNEMLVGPYKYPQDMTVGHRRGDRKQR